MKLEIKNYEDEEKGIYMFGVNILEFLEKTTEENRGVLLHKIIKDLQEVIKTETCPHKFKKKGIVFFLPELAHIYRRFVVKNIPEKRSLFIPSIVLLV